MMGEGNAVDLAQMAHEGVLRAGGAFPEERVLRYRGPLPKGDTWEGVIVDDYAVFQRLNAATGLERTGVPPGALEGLLGSP